MTALIARDRVDGSKPDTPNGVNVANLLLGLGNLYDCVQTLGVGVSSVAAGTATLTQANAGLVLVDAAAGNVIIILPACSAAVGALYQFKRLDATASTVTINRAGGDSIDGAAGITLIEALDFIEIRSDGVSTWRALNNTAVAAKELLTAGTATAYTVTPMPALNTYKAGRAYWVNFHLASGLNPTLQISGLATPPSLVMQQANGAYINVVGIPLNHRSLVVLISATQALVVTMPPSAVVVAQHFSKADSQSVAFTKTGAGTAQIKAGTRVEAGGALLTFAAATAIVMPALTAGTDYAIYACTDGSVRADANFNAPTGYTTANSRRIGGFHYAPGGHSGVSGGGNATPQINEFSLWDLKFKPACLDPRGMTLVADGFWADIYLLGVEHLVNGTSKFNVTIADGSSPPKVPAKFGGNGATAYTSLNWWEAGEVAAHHGKRLPNYTEFAALAFGTTEASSIGTDPVSTTWAAAYISKWGCALASGNMWVWGADFGGGAAGGAWAANTGGRGSTYQMENAAIFGGYWAEASNSGSRASHWFYSPTTSGSNIGSRGVCDLLILE